MHLKKFKRIIFDTNTNFNFKCTNVTFGNNQNIQKKLYNIKVGFHVKQITCYAKVISCVSKKITLFKKYMKIYPKIICLVTLNAYVLM